MSATILGCPIQSRISLPEPSDGLLDGDGGANGADLLGAADSRGGDGAACAGTEETGNAGGHCGGWVMNEAEVGRESNKGREMRKRRQIAARQ